MTNVTNIPLENAYKSNLSGSISAAATSIVVDDAVHFTLPAGQTIDVVIDPENSKRERCSVTAIDVTGKIWTVVRARADYYGHTATAVAHSGGAEIVITDSWSIFNDIATGVNSKINTADGALTAYANAAARDAAIPAPTNGMQCYLTDTGKFMDYTAGAWVAREAGGTFANASTTVAGKVEEATLAQVVAKTGTGETGARMFIAPDNAAFIDDSAGVADAGKLPVADVNGRLKASMVHLDSESLEDDGADNIQVKLKTAGGITKDANGLAATSSTSIGRLLQAEADEAITAGNAVALLPYHCKYYAPMVDVDAALGSTNQLRKYAVKFIPRQGATGLTTIYFRGRDAAASTYTLTATVETDNAGSPSGTPITNGSTTLDVTAWTTAYANRTLTFGGGGMTLVADTTYWLVLSVPTTQAANYINIGCATTYIGNYPTFERKTYDVDAGTWGAASAAAIPFFWFDLNDTIGHVLVKTDANFHAKTFNFIGLAQANAVAGDTVTVDIQYGTSTALEPMRDYFLSDTAGAIALTAGTIPYVIGKGLNATTLEIKPGSKAILGRFTNTQTTFDGYQETLVMTGFRIKEVSGVYGEGTNAHQGTNYSLNLYGDDLSFIFREGVGYGPYFYNTGAASDQVNDTSTPTIGYFRDSMSDTLACTITNISEMCFSFRFTDVDTCSNNIATVIYKAEA